MMLDTIDRRILRVLQRDGRIANNELAAAVGLSPSPCLRRVRRLEQEGVITGYTARLDPASLGKGLTLFTRIWLAAQDEATITHFMNEVRKVPEVMECYLILGDCDALVRVVAADIADYRRIQARHLSSIAGVRNIKSDVASQIIKQSTELPV